MTISFGNKPIIGIIGGTGNTGSQFKKFFKDSGYNVLVSSRKTSLKPIDLVQKADIIIYSVPIKNTVDVIKETAPFAKPGALITDVTSVKKDPVEAMLKYAPKNCEVVGMHPMFGPTIKSMKGQIVVLCKGRGEEGFLFLKNFLRSHGAIIKEIDAEKHDKIMSVVQGITHFSSIVTARAIEKSGLSLKETLEYASPVYKLQLYIIGRILAQNPELYASIQMDNPEIRRRTEQYTEVSKEVSDFVKNKNYNEFVKKFNDVSKYFGNFRIDCLKKTDYLIERLANKPQEIPKTFGLLELRAEIDKLNFDFMELLKRREKISKYIAKLKKRENLLVYDPDREKEILGNIKILAKEQRINPYNARLFFEDILERSKIEMQKIKKPSVWTLGPKGSYSEEITTNVFKGQEIGFKNTILDIFEEVSKSDSIGVVPVENSLGGSVDETSFGFLKFKETKILGEKVLQINHCLIGLNWAKPRRIKKIFAHPQTFAQCAQFIQKNYPNVEKIPVASNSFALKKIYELQNGEFAAIASERAAHIYDLKVLIKNIQDNKDNITKFFIIKNAGKTLPTGNDRTSLLISYDQDRPGILRDVVDEFANRKINLSRVESFPTGILGKYYFFIDCEGHEDDKIVKEAIDNIIKKGLNVVVLGSYERAI